jgi:Septum formation
MDTSFHLPGTTEPEIVIRRSALGSLSVLVDGTPAKRRHRRTLSYDVPLPDGTVTELRLTGQWTGLKAIVDGVETPLEPRVPIFAVVLTFLPLALVVIGGVVGALLGVGAAAINARVARQAAPWPFRILAMLGVTVAALGLTLGIAVAIAPLPVLATGSCLNGIGDGTVVDAVSARAVDCNAAHDNEVVGSVRYAETGAFPGQSTLAAYAESGCIEAFAGYVGISFEASTLQMILVTPTDLTWAKGDRGIDCVVVGADGERLTGSVKGAKR